jgi:hypothetical protein
LLLFSVIFLLILFSELEELEEVGEYKRLPLDIGVSLTTSIILANLKTLELY